MTDRERIKQIADTYRKLHVLQEDHRETTAKLIRGCVARLKSPDRTERKTAIDALVNLADLLEGRNQI